MWATLPVILKYWGCCWQSSCSWNTVRTSKLKHWNFERNVFFARPSKENRWLMLKNPKFPNDVEGKFFYRQNMGVKAAWCMTFSWWIGGKVGSWCYRNLVLSLKLPSFTWVETSKILLYVSLGGNKDPAPKLHYCFQKTPPLSLHPLLSLISNCLNLPFGTQGKS